MFIICFKVPVCQLGSVFSNNCVTSVTSNFLFLYRFCLLLLLVCLCFMFCLVLFFYLILEIVLVKHIFFSVRLCAESWQTVKSLVHTSKLFKVVLTRFVGGSLSTSLTLDRVCFSCGA